MTIRLGEIRQAPSTLDKTQPIFVVVSNPFEDEFTVVFLDNDITFSPERLTLLGSDQSSFKRPYNVRCDIRFLISEELIGRCPLVEDELVSSNSLKAISDRSCSIHRKNGLEQSCELFNQANKEFIFRVGGPVNAWPMSDKNKTLLFDNLNAPVGSIRVFGGLPDTHQNTVLIYDEHPDTLDVVIVNPGLYFGDNGIIESTLGSQYMVLTGTKFTITKSTIRTFSVGYDSIIARHMNYFHEHIQPILNSDISQIGEYYSSLSGFSICESESPKKTASDNNHEVVQVPIDGQEKDIDVDLAECVRLLNKVGLVTKNCCQGDIPGDSDHDAHAYIQFFGPNLLVEHQFNGTGSPGEDPESIPSVIIRWQRMDKVTPEAIESGEVDFTYDLFDSCDTPSKTPLGAIYNNNNPERGREYLTYIVDPVHTEDLHWIRKVAKVVDRLIKTQLSDITLTENECSFGVGYRKITTGIPPRLKQEIQHLYHELRRDWNVNVAAMCYSDDGIVNKVKMEAACHVPFNAKLNKWYMVIPANGDIVLRQITPYRSRDVVVVVDIVVGTLSVDFS